MREGGAKLNAAWRQKLTGKTSLGFSESHCSPVSNNTDDMRMPKTSSRLWLLLASTIGATYTFMRSYTSMTRVSEGDTHPGSYPIGEDADNPQASSVHGQGPEEPLPLGHQVVGDVGDLHSCMLQTNHLV